MSANYEDSTYAPPKWSKSKTQDVVSKRRQGLYTCDDTIDEVLVCVKQLRENKADRVSGLILRHGAFSVYDTAEFKEQVDAWKQVGVGLRPGNVFERQCGKFGKVWFFTVQPIKMTEDNAPGACPIALAFGRMVSGYTYFTLDKRIPEWLIRVLPKCEATYPSEEGGESETEED